MDIPYPLPQRKPYSADRVRELFNAAGVPIARWAESNGYSRHQVYCVIGGQFKGNRGKAHEIALALGMKLSVKQLSAA